MSGHLVVHPIEHHLDRHADGELLVGQPTVPYPHALLELDDHRVVRRVLEGGMLEAWTTMNE
jgi:hypothetical protein